jgi:N-acetylmuramoyl-L-alanine amidase
MRYQRTVFVLLSLLVLLVSCGAGRRPETRGVQGSYETEPMPSFSSLKPLVIIDPGHGGTDEGAKVNGFMEKRIALVTAQMVRKHLEALGYRVIMTRNKDVYITLPRRAAMANKAKGSLFVSIHFNSSPREDAQGIEIFYFDSKELWRTKASRRLAHCILRETLGETQAVSRGIKQGNFHVIRETEMPAVLVEGGFITNKQERSLLRDKEYLNRLAIGIADGIDCYMKL